MSCRANELETILPLILGCPADDEWFFVGNAMGGAGEFKYARRSWAAIKACLTSGVVLPYVGVVDRGNADDPSSGTDTFTNSLLIGLGANNNGDVQIVYAEVLRSNFGENSSFTFDSLTGTIILDGGEEFFPQSSLYVDRNQ